ncbi:hypothetical protein K488DRAFT_71817 [Vararia minispora EC-137]|uniref:Uncharacterized protein n=1 Tax=Vararia minispora EC-137 TaxID=1314806 RepID=A0ACB8QGZ9_9AGAM|nr:hypothetical protein K488DRAFT_71817 [Vararia minispora EC-137]
MAAYTPTPELLASLVPWPPPEFDGVNAFYGWILNSDNLEACLASDPYNVLLDPTDPDLNIYKAAKTIEAYLGMREPDFHVEIRRVQLPPDGTEFQTNVIVGLWGRFRTRTGEWEPITIRQSYPELFDQFKAMVGITGEPRWHRNPLQSHHWQQTAFGTGHW